LLAASVLALKAEDAPAGLTPPKPPVKPEAIRVVPPDGYLVGPGVTIDGAKQLMGKGGATGSVTDSGNGSMLKLTFPPGTGEESVTLKPSEGRWDLREYLELRVKVRNDGQVPVTPSVVAGSNGRPSEIPRQPHMVETDTIAADAPIAPGAEAEIVVPFMNPKVWQNTPPAMTPEIGTANRFTNNSGASVTISVPGTTTAQALTVESIRADQPVYSAPDWLGQRPPVEGDWVKTFDDEFDGPTINEKNWNLVSENYWDKRTHFSKDETSIVDGQAVLHYEKKTGYPKDDPTQKPTDYASGYLDSYGKWVQRYGYFEARVKYPKAPGLWPCFWLMPDRGIAAGPQWKRADTGNGGMEFDMAEFLSGWGTNRYSIGVHWDGYGKTHKTTSSSLNYIQPDKDGFITSGLLWLPGKAIVYGNGKEVWHFESDRISTVQSNIIFSFVSGGWDNLPLDDAKLPDAYVVDYVRAWQRKDLASPVDGYQTAPAAH